MASKKTPDEYGILRQMILKGELLPSERLVEADLAERLGSNRANVRRAFAKLEQDGLVTSEPFKGTRVRKLTEGEAIEIFEVRAALELLLVRHATTNATAADHANLKSMVKKMKSILGKDSPIEVGRASRAVRVELWKIARHSTAEQLLDKLNSRIVNVWFQGMSTPGRAEAIVADIDALVVAVCEGSTEKAVRAMRVYHEKSIANLRYAIRMHAR